MVGTVIAKVSGASGGATLAVEGGTSSTTYELSKTDGSANDHLKTDGAGNLAWVAPPVASTPGLVKLQSTEVTTGVAAVIFDSSVVTAYDNYLLIVNAIKTASAAANGTVAIRTDYGSTFIGRQKFYARVIDMYANSDGGIHTSTFTSDSVTVPIYWDNHNTEPLNSYMYFLNCNPETDNTYSVHCIYNATYTNQSPTRYNLRGAAMYSVTAGQQINYFKLLNSTENISEGRVTLYGMDQQVRI